MMRENKGFFIAVAVGLLLPARIGFADEQERPGIDPNLAVGVMAGDNTAELRVGIQWGILEGYVAPRYDKTLASEGDIATDLRLYGIVNAVNPEIVTKLFGQETPIPAGTVYPGAFIGWKFQDGQTEAGWLIGGRIKIERLDVLGLKDAELRTEYQRLWQTFRDDSDRYAVIAGPCWKF